MSLDVYRDYFTRENLMLAIEKAPYTPGQLGQLGVFETVGLTSTTLAIEQEATEAGKVMVKIARGAPRPSSRLEKRTVHTFMTETYGDQGAVYADEVLAARGVGATGAAEILADRRDRTVARLRRTVDLTLESLRMQCALNPTNSLGTAPADVTIALTVDTTKTRQEIFNKLILPVEAELDGVPFTGLHALCSNGFWAALIENKAIRDTYLNYQAAAQLRNDPREAVFFGGVLFERYRGAGTVKVTDNKAVVIPLGVPELFVQAFAPNDTVESVGQGALGQPYYLGSKPIEDSQGTKGWEISVQTHPVMVCTRPAAIQKVVMA